MAVADNVRFTNAQNGGHHTRFLAPAACALPGHSAHALRCSSRNRGPAVSL